MDKFTTPMMKQYRDIRRRYPDCLLFYRMGDFYELFMEDAFIGANILNITLTHKRGGKDGNIPMSGIPYHAVDVYLAKLVKVGYKVAICEQLSPPNKRGLVERDVIRVVTPGTVLDENALDKKSNNYLISLIRENETIALSVADISTGYFAVIEHETQEIDDWLIDELSRLSPSECILSDELYNDTDLLKLLKNQEHMNIYPYKDWHVYADNASIFLKKHFGVTTLAAFGIEDKPLALAASAGLLGYLTSTQKTSLHHIQKIIFSEQENCVLLDKSTMRNLELFATIHDQDTRGSLFSFLDKTITAMGGRLLKQWMKKPLLEKESILERQDGVSELLERTSEREKLVLILNAISDIERIISRLSVNIGNARDLMNANLTLQKIMEIKKSLSTSKSVIFRDMYKNVSFDIDKVISVISARIVDEPPIDTKNGGMIKKGINKELDNLYEIINNSKEWMLRLEKKEREETGISSLKIRFNQVFGFYIEVSRSNVHLVPKHYMRKQTLVNGERFITFDLKKHEEIILTAEEKAHELEFKLFQNTLKSVLTYTECIQKAATAIAILDVLITFSYLSETYHLVRPKLLYSGEIRILKGRHPVVEKLLPDDKQFVPNDVCLDNITHSLLILTGPNMAGKSVFIRQVAIIVLMNQMGCFVPARSAHLSLVDRIFVRSGASDIITSGMSTFMVEMVETAHILHNATSNSLIVMDEIGRGTSTYDGISIAWAIAEYIAKHFKPSPKTLFATHYHELQDLEKEFSTIKNYHMEVTDNKGQPIFLHTLLSGGSSHSFGVAVAKLAGVPSEVIHNATIMLNQLEKRNMEIKSSFIDGDSSLSIQENRNEKLSQDFLTMSILQKDLSNLDIAHMTPLEALNFLAKLKDKILLAIESKNKYLNAD